MRPDEYAAVSSAVLTALTSPPLPLPAPVDVTFDTLRLTHNAAIVECTDPATLATLAEVRAAVAAVLRTHPAILALGPDLVDRLCSRAPNIVHMTVLRFGDGGGAAHLESAAAELREKFDAIDYVPFSLRVRSLQVVVEARPYMHLDLEGEDAGCILAHLPMGRGNEGIQ